MTKYKGLKKTVGQMLEQNNRGLYLQVDYNTKDHKLLTELHCDFGRGSQAVYADRDIIFIGMYDRKVTMKQLEKDIDTVIER